MSTRPTCTPLQGGSFNLLFGRDVDRVAREVMTLLRKHDLDFLCVQEARDYFDVLRAIPDYRYVSTRRYKGGSQVGILVKREHKLSRPTFRSLGDGWFVVGTKIRHAPVTFPRVTINNWLRVGAIHLPTPTHWPHGKLVAASDRADDYLAAARVIKRFLTGKQRIYTRLVAGDWNEPPTHKGEWSPGWIAMRAGATAVAPPQLAGHGRIDYPIVADGRLLDVTKDLAIAENSDHEPVIFTVQSTLRQSVTR